MLLSYACSFPHSNIHTYIMYIFRVSILMCKCSYDSIPLYNIHMKVYYYCLTLNCCCPLSNCYCLTLSCYCLTLNRYCLTFLTVTVWLFQPLLFRHLNCYCLHLNCYCLDIWIVIVYILNCYCPTVII
jgi:hypothetical protein